jgi:hypothetical protein
MEISKTLRADTERPYGLVTDDNRSEHIYILPEKGGAACCGCGANPPPPDVPLSLDVSVEHWHRFYRDVQDTYAASSITRAYCTALSLLLASIPFFYATTELDLCMAAVTAIVFVQGGVAMDQWRRRRAIRTTLTRSMQDLCTFWQTFWDASGRTVEFVVDGGSGSSSGCNALALLTLPLPDTCVRLRRTCWSPKSPTASGAPIVTREL